MYKINLCGKFILGKKKKLEKHSEEEINNAVHTASYGYMTRNRLNKELKGKL